MMKARNLSLQRGSSGAGYPVDVPGSFVQTSWAKTLRSGPRNRGKQAWWSRHPEPGRHGCSGPGGWGCLKTRGNLNGGSANGGLGLKGANWAKKGPFRTMSTSPPPLWLCTDLPPAFSENLGLKPPFVRPRLDFPSNFSHKSIRLIFRSLMMKIARKISCRLSPASCPWCWTSSQSNPRSMLNAVAVA